VVDSIEDRPPAVGYFQWVKVGRSGSEWAKRGWGKDRFMIPSQGNMTIADHIDNQSVRQNKERPGVYFCQQNVQKNHRNFMEYFSFSASNDLLVNAKVLL